MDEHSLQSPFLFQVYQNALNPSLRKKVSNQKTEVLRRRLQNDPRSINASGFGSGSSMSVKQSKQVSNIVKSGITSRKQSEILVNLIEHFKCQKVLELGTSLGINAIYLSVGATVEQLTTVEGNKEIADIAKDNFNEWGVLNIHLINSDIDQFLAQSSELFDCIYIDANHTYQATIEYFKSSLTLMSDSGLIVLDDINWSPYMRRAWEDLISQFPNHLYVENDKLGIVFVNVELEKNHYFLSF